MIFIYIPQCNIKLLCTYQSFTYYTEINKLSNDLHVSLKKCKK